jgi:hypothetical protein
MKKLTSIGLIMAILGTMFLPFFNALEVKAQSNPNPTVLFTHPFKKVIKTPVFQGYENKLRKYHFLGGDLIFTRIINPRNDGKDVKLLMRETGEVLQDNYPYNENEVYNWRNTSLV